MKKKISQASLSKRSENGARVIAKTPAEKKVPEQAQSTVSMEPVGKGMAAMAASLAAMQARQDAMGERMVEQLEKLNARTKATIRVTERTDTGGIDAAEVEIVG